MITFNLSKIRKGTDRLSFYADLFMIWLVLTNLAWIVFDWHFGFQFFRNFLESLSPAFFAYYRDVIHPDFLFYDLIFVSIYIAEFMVRWAVAVKNKTYYKWFFFPFANWYDVLGCIPLGSFRALRIFRIFSMIYRLQRMEVIDLRQTYVFQLGKKYYYALVEEVSDRVVLNVLESAQREIADGNPVTGKMIKEVIKPQQEVITEWLSHRVKKVADHNYTLYRADIKEYLEEVIRKAVKGNSEIKNIELIPVLGKQVSKALEKSISDITFNVLNGMVQDLASDRNNKVIEEITEILFEALLLEEDDHELNKITKEIFIKAVEVIKEQVEVKQWRVEEEKERGEVGLSVAV